MPYTVRDYAYQVYRLISASNPYLPLRNGDEAIVIQVLNQLLQAYAATGLMITIANTVTASVSNGNDGVIFTPENYVFTPPSQNLINPVQIAEGRLANLDNAWLLLSGVTYPLIYKSRDEYLAAWKYNPLSGLPRFIILFPETDYVEARLYPSPSQSFTFQARGKFQLSELTKDSDLSALPQYYIRYLLFAGARDVAMYTGRSEAWTDKLEALYIEAKDVMEGSAEINLAISGDEQSLLNGAWRVRAGI